MSKSKREELQKASKKFKDSLESQIEDLKENFDKVGKTALIVGGGLLGAYLLSNALTSTSKKRKKKNKKEEQADEGNLPLAKENLLSATLKEEAIVFLLGLATERLRTFLKETDNEKNEQE